MTNLPTRNNNPGDLRDTKTGSFRTFSNPQEGFNALKNDLQIKIGGKSTTGITPDSDLLHFSSVYAPKGDGNDPVQYAQNLSKKLGVPVNTPIKNLSSRLDDFASAIADNEGYQGNRVSSMNQSAPQQQEISGGSRLTQDQLKANIDAMEKQGAPREVVQSYLDSLKGSGGTSGQGFNPKPFSNPDPSATGLPGTSTISPNVDVPKKADDGFLSKLGKGDFGGAAFDAVKGTTNFLFPIVGDVYHDVKGDSKKTFLQQTGDAALSVLPFIPGLGEVGEGARAAEAGVEGAGLVSKALASPVARGAITGYGAGVASNLSQGQGLGESFKPNINNVAGAVLGGATPKIVEGASGLLKKIAGIDPQIENELSRMGSKGNPEDVNLYNQYMNATKEHAGNLRATSPLTMAADNLDTASEAIDKKIKAAGEEVRAENKGGEAIPLEPQKIAPVASTLNSELDNKFGVKIAVNKDGQHVLVSTRRGGVELTSTEKQRVLSIAKKIDALGNNGNVRMADDLMTELDKKLDYGTAQDPLKSLFKRVRGELNGAARDVAPNFAAANDKMSNLLSLKEEIEGMAGKNNNRGELLMRRIFSGDKSGDVQDLFGKIEKETGIDLVKHAVLAKHAIQSIGSKSDRTLLEKVLGDAIQGQSTGSFSGKLFDAAIGAGKAAVKKVGVNPETIGRNIVKGKTTGLVKSALTKTAIEASRGVKNISSR